MMKMRSAFADEEAFDGLTAQEIRRIRDSARLVVPGMEGLAKLAGVAVADHAVPAAAPAPKKRGRR